MERLPFKFVKLFTCASGHIHDNHQYVNLFEKELVFKS